jgi:ABC-type Fe3+-siderophore transport system permease subunit
MFFLRFVCRVFCSDFWWVQHLVYRVLRSRVYSATRRLSGRIDRDFFWSVLFAVLIIAFETFLFTSLAAWIGYYILAFGAFVGAGLTAFLVYRIASKNGRPNVTTMLLAGIAINAIAGALTGLMTYMSTEQQLRTITFWMLGSLGGATWDNLRALAPLF